MKTNELTGAALDWAVAKCEAHDWFLTTPGNHLCVWKACPLTGEQESSISYRPSTNWAQGGPIIERESIAIDTNVGSFWYAYKRPCEISQRQVGPTPLIAAMRCYCALKLGDEVDVPKGLL